ncbi:MAG: hypothetical protein QW757_04115 [Candidatus Woesearchaeota archaeon]
MVKIAKKEEKKEVQDNEKKSHETKTDEGKTIAIISYITWIGLLIAFIMNNEKKNEFAKFHIRQSLLLTLAGFVGMFIFWIPLVGWVLGLGLFVLWILALISAINGEKKELPLVGKLAQDWFKGI